ncbi:MAG: DUF3272 family protein [Streptococcus sp.]|nr:DUF3272 family protein [Streptococcus sp.]
MTKKQFIYLAFVCASEVYFFNRALFNNDWLLTIFLGCLILNHLKCVYIVSKLTNIFINSKKKD